MLVVNKKSVVRFILILLIISTVAFIWWNSIADAEESSKMSGTVVEIVKPIIDPQDKIDDDTFSGIIRKLAHFSEFALLGAEMIILFLLYEKPKRSLLISGLIPAGISFLVAVSDEHIQLTSAGRCCDIQDMLIDLCGIICGTVFVLIIKFIADKVIYRTQTKSREGITVE